MVDFVDGPSCLNWPRINTFAITAQLLCMCTRVLEDVNGRKWRSSDILLSSPMFTSTPLSEQRLES